MFNNQMRLEFLFILQVLIRITLNLRKKVSALLYPAFMREI
jgi:hypothetical protein